MTKSDRKSDRKLVITLVLLGMAVVATIIFNESRSDKRNCPDLEGDITSKIKPSKMQNNVANWFATQNKVKPY